LSDQTSAIAAFRDTLVSDRGLANASRSSTVTVPLGGLSTPHTSTAVT
jgi:hypothetical protein